MALKLSQIVLALSERLQLSLSDMERVREVAATIDVEALRTEEAQRYQIRIWEPGMRAPTGVLFEDVFPELKQGAIGYLIIIDGQPVIFNVRHPKTGELLKDAESTRRAAEEEVAGLIEAAVNQKQIDLVLEKLLE